MLDRYNSLGRKDISQLVEGIDQARYDRGLVFANVDPVCIDGKYLKIPLDYSSLHATWPTS